MKIFLWFMAALLLGALAMYIYFSKYYLPKETISHRQSKNFDVLLLKLPRHGGPDIFGPQYWKVNHYLANLIPCSICKNDAVPLEIFKHDIVNLKLDKKVFDKENWKTMVAAVNELNKKA